MLPHLEEYILSYPNCRFVFIEKRNKLAEMLLNSFGDNWNNVIYMDNDVIFLVSDKLKKFVLIAYSTKRITNKQGFNIFSNFLDERTDGQLNMTIVFDYHFYSLSKTLKTPQFINWYLSMSVMCLKKIKNIKEHMKNYNNNVDTFDYKYIETSILLIGIFLKEQSENLTNSYYEKSNDEFFETPIL